MLYLLFTFVLSIIYVWTLYNIPTTVAGVRRLRRANRERENASMPNGEDLPAVSILVPVKNEEKVVGRLLKSLLSQDYPSDRVEIIIVDDGSIDRTVEICRGYAERHSDQIRLLQQSKSNGKPTALNYALEHAKGEIIATFDADNVPERGTLRKAAGFLKDPSVAAVQGTICSINADENMLTKFLSYEEAVRFKAYMGGKDVLDLFVHLAGSCQFVRRRVLDAVGGWRPDSLSEDMEMSARLTERDYRIKYALEMRSWQESPVSMSQLVNQRLRWYRGCLDTAFGYGRLLRKLSWKRIDAEATLVGPCMLTLSLVGFLMGLFTLVVPFSRDLFFTILAQATTVLTGVTLLLGGLALIYVTKPRRIRNVLWLPFIYAYWTLQTFLASYALFQVVLRRPKKWRKTARSGVVTNHSLET